MHPELCERGHLPKGRLTPARKHNGCAGEGRALEALASHLLTRAGISFAVAENGVESRRISPRQKSFIYPLLHLYPGPYVRPAL